MKSDKGMKLLLVIVAVLGVSAGVSAPFIARHFSKVTAYSSVTAVVLLCAAIAFRIESVRRKRIKKKIEDLMAGRQPLSSEEFGKLFPPSQSSLATALHEYIKPYFPFDIARIRPDDRIHEDLELRYWDDLADVDVLKWIEKSNQISFKNEETARIETIRDLVDATERKRLSNQAL